MRILICPDKFKGSLTALEAAEAMARGFARARPGVETVLVPIADGGEGTAEAILAAAGGEWRRLRARDPLGREVEARYGWLPDRVAVVDMSEASGLWRLAREERDPLRANTFGTGELMAAALRAGAKKVLVGLGGSATNDGGAGMAAALGFRFLDAAGRVLMPVPADLVALARIEPPLEPFAAEVVGLSDVTNPLTGELGAARVFGPQKGADPAAVEALEAVLEQLAEVAARDLGRAFRQSAGAGAAGGLGFGLMTFCGASIRSGFETLSAMLRLEEQIAECDAVVTGEGSLDAQTLGGKGPAGVAVMARRLGKPVFAFAGQVAEDPRLAALYDGAVAITPPGMPLSEAFEKAGLLLEAAAASVSFLQKPGA